MKKNIWHFSKQKYIFEEVANESIDEIQNLSKQIDFNNLIYSFKGKSDPKKFIGFRYKWNYKRRGKIRKAKKVHAIKNVKTLWTTRKSYEIV